MNNKQKKLIIFYIILLFILNISIDNKLIFYLTLTILVIFLTNSWPKKSLFLVTGSLFLLHFFYSNNSRLSWTHFQFIFFNHYQLIVPSITLLFLFFTYYIFNKNIQSSIIYPSHFAIYSIEKLKSKKDNYFDRYSNSRKKLNATNIKYLLKDIPRHGYLNYTNRHSLSEEYFKLSQSFIEQDDRLYLILSETGSPASEIISLFTQTDYNHLSLSFDRSLKTMISYNGGNNHQQPGLNTENIDHLQQKEDSQLLVYSIHMTKDQQLIILNKIRQIDKEGSAYNVVGLLTHLAIRPNIMYCSEFIYHMLSLANHDVFEIKDLPIKPTDFIDYDLDKKLTCEYKIDFPTTVQQKVQ